MKLDRDNYKKDRIFCEECYNKKRKNSINVSSGIETSSSQHQPKSDNNNAIVSTLENPRRVTIGPGIVSRNCYMLKLLEKKGNKRPYQIIDRSPTQYPI